jgi:hypothetical protein
MVVDIVFSIDSVITAVGMVKQVVGDDRGERHRARRDALGARPISAFVERHPTIKILALAFLVMIGGNLFVEGFGYHIPKGYTYFAMAFSVGVETLEYAAARAAVAGGAARARGGLMPSAMPALLAGLVDYAGLFPPAALTMPDAVARYAATARGRSGHARAVRGAGRPAGRVRPPPSADRTSGRTRRGALRCSRARRTRAHRAVQRTNTARAR